MHDVRRLRQRLEAVRWWLEQTAEYPAGLVPFTTACRVLAVSRTRLLHLCKDGRVRLVAGMPGGAKGDRFIPVADLIAAPFALERGRPGRYGPENRRKDPRISEK